MLPDQTATGEERRWDQGSLLTIETVNSLVAADVLPSEWKNKGYALVISHPCDLAADTAVEPFVEFVLATPIEQPDGNYRYGKSGRKLHLMPSSVTAPNISRYPFMIMPASIGRNWYHQMSS